MPIDLRRLDPPSTPALVLLRDVLERNLDAMQARCDAAGVGLRVHGKMHKCSTLAKLQIAKGAVGVCAQTVGEAEAFVAAGIGDVLVTSPASLKAVGRVAALVGSAKVAAVADEALLAQAFGQAARQAGVTLDVLVDIDLGQHRTGVRPPEALALAKRIAGTEGLRFGGVQAYGGHLQHIVDVPARLAANDKALATLAGVVAELRAAGLAPGIVTGGGTGTHASDLASGVFTEIQAGSYAVMDAEYDASGGPDGDWAFGAALVLACTVVSARHKTHVTVDAGLKALSVDGPPARVVSGAAEGSIWRPMGDEHGAIFHPSALGALKAAGRDPLAFAAVIDAADADLPAPNDAPKLGDVIWLQPGHCDPTVNLYDAFLVAEPDSAWTRWPIDARRVTD
jgi:D-serine deaminase-like pyridoxal phosphate-dependent protein